MKGIEAEVPGVLNLNSKIRDRHLKGNYGKYFQYTEKLVPAIGEVYNIDYNRPLYSITDNQSLLEYTHNGSQKYGDSINRKYFNKNREKDIYSVKELSFDQIQAWGGDYTDYISYLDDVLGEDIYSRHVRYINDLLSGQYMENALRQTEVGVVRNINIPVAKQGIITTNPNNLKGLDTPLGTITNYMYSTLLYNGAIFNSDRKSQDKYITRSLINQYGNNLSNVTKLGDMLRVGVGDYELRDDLGADVHIIHSFKDAVGDLNIHWMTKNVENAKNYLSEFNKGFNGYELGKDGYVNYVEGNENIFELTDFSKEVHFKSEYNQGYDKTYDIYNENDNSNNGYTEAPTNENDAAWENYKKIDGSDEKSKSILSKTSRLFNEHKINTLIGRFHTSVDGGISTEQEFIDTAKSKYGNSHGRNLLTRKAQDSEVADADDTNGYDNPYCRTWTYHHQYNQVKKLIRPFITVDDNGEEKAMSIESVQMANGKYRSRDRKSGKLIGPKYLGDNTVLNENGFVNICPSGDQSVINTNTGTRIEKCMFSIENLAWKDVPKFTKENYISKEQTGPNGGRIMWFPPYDLSFSENVNVAWNESTFIGRGEKVYTYTNTDRTGTLSFTLLIDHPSIVNTFSRLQDGDLSSDIDSDILRYFAGCEIPEIKEEKKEEETIPITPPVTPPEPKHGEIKFYVYFPNNFSGMVSAPKETFSDNDNDIKYYDKDWWAYILAGNNCSISDDKNLWVGYETTKDYGISRIFANDHREHTEDDIKRIKETIQKEWIGVSQCWWDNKGGCVGSDSEEYNENDAVDKFGNEVVIKTGNNEGNWCFKYRPDKDLRQKLGRYLEVPNPQLISFVDNNSQQLNTYLGGYQKDANYSFGEVIGALINSKKIKETITEKIKPEELLVFLKEHGCDGGAIEQLSEIFSTDEITYDDIIIEGSADQNDKKNANMLATRRAYSIKMLLKEYGIEPKKFECSGKRSAELPEKVSNALKNKLQRFSFVTIKYTIPGTKQALSSVSRNATNQEEMSDKEREEENKKFNTWFETLCKNSQIINEYNEIFDNENYEKKYELFKEDLKVWCSNNQISYNVEEYKTDNDWINVINKIVSEYKYEYFIPSKKLYTYLDTFINHLKDHKPIDSDKNIDKEINKLNSQIDGLRKYAEDLSKRVSGLTDELTELNKKEEKKDLQTKIDECNDKITCYIYGGCPDSKIGTKEYEEIIRKINYELYYWTTEKGDKNRLLNDLKKSEKELSRLESQIAKEKAKRDKYRQELDEIEEEKKEIQKEIEKNNKLIQDSLNEADSKERDKNSLVNKKSQGKGLETDKIKTEIYYERLSQYNNNIFETLKLKDENEFNYYVFGPKPWRPKGQERPTTSLFEIDINMIIPGEFPYDGYNKNHDKSFIKETTITMSYNHLLKDYLLIKLLDEYIDEGFEFACDYLMSNQESETKMDLTDDDESDYSQLKDLLFIKYLLSGKKNDKQNDWYISSVGTNANISYYDAWQYMAEHMTDIDITYQPFNQTLIDVENAINDYRETYNVNDYDKDTFDKMIKLIKSKTDSVLKYCDTVISEIMAHVIVYAETALDEASKNAEKNAQKSQSLRRSYNQECETLKSINDKVNKMRDQYLYSVFMGSGYTRYETEGEYFNKLNIEHPLIFKSIKEKFKYFNPAFHSMSPEGFNARLNFLHQCTRQGHTYEAKSDNGIKTANNLAFGRMPVCVLRIGDFINTRIIINNVNINYDNGGVQWDLNPEGIGVQPMYAKVNLGITIIGGQSLSGPISRLQNAVSFDFYANTGVYDDRADRIHKGIDGNDAYDYVFNIKPTEEDNGKYTLYRSAKSTVEQANEDTIKTIQDNQKAYNDAQKELDGFNLSEGNDKCNK